MRLVEIAKLAGRRGAISYLQKHGGYVLPALAVGAIGAEALRKGNRYYDDTFRDMNRALERPLDPSVAEKRGGFMESFLGGMSGMKPTAMKPGQQMSTISPGQHAGSMGGQLAMQMLSPIIQAPGQGVAERIKGIFGPKQPGMFEMAQGKAIEGLGKAVASAGTDLLKDVISKAISAAGNIGNSSMRNALLGALKQEDPILSEADDKELMEAYHTMVRFAPTLSTDKNAVRSFLRQAVMSGSGPDYATIKLLADSERAVTGGKD